MKNLIIKPYKSGDEFNFHKLDRKLEIHKYNRRDPSNFIWKYRGKNPSGFGTNYFAYINDKIIGHFGAVPLKYIVNKKIAKGACSIAMMIEPQWQNKGLIKFVGDEVFKELKKKSIKFVYGYPNDRSFDLHLKFWKYFKIIDQKNFVLKKNKKFLIREKIEIIKLKKFDKIYDKLWKKNKNYYEIAVVRDKDYLNWRYIHRPDHSYYCYSFKLRGVIYGYAVLKYYKFKNKFIGHIIDFFFPNIKEEQLKDLFKTLINELIKNNVDEISTWCNGSPEILTVLKNIGFKVSGSRPMIMKFLNENKNFCKYFTSRNKKWYFTMGDTLEIY